MEYRVSLGASAAEAELHQGALWCHIYRAYHGGQKGFVVGGWNGLLRELDYELPLYSGEDGCGRFGLHGGSAGGGLCWAFEGAGESGLRKLGGRWWFAVPLAWAILGAGVAKAAEGGGNGGVNTRVMTLVVRIETWSTID